MISPNFIQDSFALLRCAKLYSEVKNLVVNKHICQVSPLGARRHESPVADGSNLLGFVRPVSDIDFLRHVWIFHHDWLSVGQFVVFRCAGVCHGAVCVGFWQA
jgi:hypothetical protein